MILKRFCCTLYCSFPVLFCADLIVQLLGDDGVQNFKKFQGLSSSLSRFEKASHEEREAFRLEIMRMVENRVVTLFASHLAERSGSQPASFFFVKFTSGALFSGLLFGLVSHIGS